MAISPQPTKPDRLTQTQAEFSINASNIVDWQGEFADELNSVSSTYYLSVSTTSTTSNTIGTGSKSFTVQTGLGFVLGNAVRIANSGTNYMTGDVTSYNSGTGALVVNVTSSAGSGTHTSWTISLAAVGASSASDVSATPSGNLSGTTVQAQLQELDTEKLSSAAGAVTGTNLEDITTAETVGSAYVIPVITKDVNGRITSATTAQKITSGTVVNTTSGTSHDFTSIPSGVKRIVGMLRGVSTSGTSIILVQIGDSGGIENTGYDATGATLATSGSTSDQTIGFPISGSNAAANVHNCTFELLLEDAATFTWMFKSQGRIVSNMTFGSGGKALSAALDRIRLTTVNGTDTFDAGTFNILTY